MLIERATNDKETANHLTEKNPSVLPPWLIISKGQGSATYTSGATCGPSAPHQWLHMDSTKKYGN